MLLLGLAGLFASVACGAACSAGWRSAVGKALVTVVAAIGVALGTTVGTVVDGLGGTALSTASFGIIAGSSVVIAGSVAVRKLVKKARLAN